MHGNQVRKDLQPVPHPQEVRTVSERSSSLQPPWPQLWGPRPQLCRGLPQLWVRGSSLHLPTHWLLLVGLHECLCKNRNRGASKQCIEKSTVPA